MTEQEQQHQIPEPTEPPAPAPGPAPVEAEAKPRLRDRVLGMRAVVAVALAGLILGGVGGATVGALVDHDQEHGPGQFQRPGPPDGMRGGPPGTTPQDEVRPDSGGDTSSSGDTA